jgi:hypothetical protein
MATHRSEGKADFLAILLFACVPVIICVVLVEMATLLFD